MNITDDQLNMLKTFIAYCQNHPKILHAPKFAFFKEFLEHFNAQIPPPENGEPMETEESNPHTEEESHPHIKEESHPHTKVESNPEPVESSESEEEPEITLEPLMSREEVPPLPFVEFDPEQEISEDRMDESYVKQKDAVAAGQRGEWEAAVVLYTEAIECNPTSANLYAKRSMALLNLSRPMGAINDCEHALRINPDCRLAFKYRGRARRCILELEGAALDLALAYKLDYDEETHQWLREIEPSVKLIKQYKRGKQLRADRKKFEERRRRAAQAEYERSMGEEMPSMGNLGDVLNDPELLEAMKDPEVMAALMAMQKDPSSMSRYKDNPKVQEFIDKMSRKFGGGV